MSALLRGKDYEKLVELIDEAFESKLKNIHTCIPATVQEYNIEKRRVKVKISVTTRQISTGTQVQKPIIANVPVIFPSAMGFIIHCFLKKKDAVLLLFSERGISNFLNSYQEEKSDGIGFFSLNDAIAIPSFSSIEKYVLPQIHGVDITEGISIGTFDSQRYFLITSEVIRSQQNVKNVIEQNDEGILITTADGDTTNHIIIYKNGDIEIKGMGESRIISDGDIKVTSAGNIEATATGSIKAIATGNVEATSDVKIKLKAPIIEIEGNVESLGTLKNNTVNVGSTHIHATLNGPSGVPM